MTDKELANIIDGRQYLEEMTNKEENIAKENGLVVVFGTSDDLIEFRGAIDDELGCWEGGTVWIDIHGNIRYINSFNVPAKKIEAVWNDRTGAAWQYNTDIPHAKFNIFDDDELYCIGIVFSLKEAFGV